MNDKPMDNRKLDQMLKSAYPAVEVSPDFTLQLWRRLIAPERPAWLIPAPAAGIAAAVGILLGLWTWPHLPPAGGVAPSALRQVERMDLFGNAPVDSVAGTYLQLTETGRSQEKIS